MTFQRLAVVLLGLVFVALIGVVGWSTITDGGGQPSDAPAASATGQTSAGGGEKSVPPSGSVGRALAGFVLIGGWGLGVVTVIVRAQQRRHPGASTDPTSEEARAGA